MTFARATTAALTDPHGHSIRLGPLIGRGGEGAVYAVEGRHGTLAKLYHEPLTPERTRKIEALTAMRSPGLEAVCAMPTGLVRRGGSAVGFLMPHLPDRIELHELHGPQSRRVKFPSAGFAFLVHVAGNIARAFALLHAADILVGDVNDRGVLVAQDGTVRIIDCDSFQVSSRGRILHCNVGVLGFTPPELQGANLRGAVRAADHDNFSLAILVFLLLFMGRHPFAGRFKLGSIDLETAIRECRYAYSADHARTSMTPPPKTLPAANVAGAEVAQLFERAFSPATLPFVGVGRGTTVGRPTATEWVQVLDRLKQELVSCSLNHAHAYVNGLSSCPWCELEQASGADLFNFIMPPEGRAAVVDLEQIWNAVLKLTVPVVPDPISSKIALNRAHQSTPPLLPKQAELLRLNEEAHRARQFATSLSVVTQVRKRALSQFLLNVDLANVQVLDLENLVARRRKAASSWLVSVSSFLGARQLHARREKALADAQAQFEQAREDALQSDRQAADEVIRMKAAVAGAEDEGQRVLQLAEAMEFRAETLHAEFNCARAAAIAIADRNLAQTTRNANETRRALDALKPVAVSLGRHLMDTRLALGQLRAKWQQLDREQKRVMDQLHTSERANQLQLHLAKHFIANANINGITRTLIATLASFGIETAADVNEDDVDEAPGFGPVRTRAMIDWRNSMARKFRHVANQAPDPARIKAIDHRFAMQRHNLERHFPKAKTDVERRIASVTTWISDAKKASDDAECALAQAENDRKVLG